MTRCFQNSCSFFLRSVFSSILLVGIQKEQKVQVFFGVFFHKQYTCICIYKVQVKELAGVVLKIHIHKNVQMPSTL